MPETWIARVQDVVAGRRRHPTEIAARVRFRDETPSSKTPDGGSDVASHAVVNLADIILAARIGAADRT